jgi:hypothetical protein
MTLSTCLRDKYSEASDSSKERHREPKHNRRTTAQAREQNHARSIGIQPSEKEEDLVQETPEATLVAEHQYMFERHDQKLVLFAFMTIFVSYCPQFWGSEVIYKAHDTKYMFERHGQKLIIFMFLAIFMSYCPQSWVFVVIYKAHDTKCMFERHEQNLPFLCYRAIFMSYCPQFWVSRVIYKAYGTQYMFERHDQKLIVFMF